MIFDFFEQAAKSAKNIRIIGYSVLGRPIFAFYKGRQSNRKALISGGIHAREYITARLICRMVEEYNGETEIVFVPLINPDGVSLVIDGLKSVPYWRRRALYRYNGNSEDFSQWKANVNAVDLNVNFDALWGSGAKNINYPNSENYIGPYPFSERESRTMRELTISENFLMTISYHTKGQEIYHGFNGNNNYKNYSEKFSELTGYPLLTTPDSAGGYKDWYVSEFNRLGLTIEAGEDRYPHPLPDIAFPKMLEENIRIPSLIDSIAEELETEYKNCCQLGK